MIFKEEGDSSLLFYAPGCSTEKFIASFKDFQAFYTCPDNSRFKMKTCMEH